MPSSSIQVIDQDSSQHRVHNVSGTQDGSMGTVGGPRQTTTVTIADSASLSGASIDLGGYGLVGLMTPSGWSTQAITFQVSQDGSNWFNLYDKDGEVVLASVPASAYVALNPATFYGARYVKVRSGTSGSAANQSGGDVVTLVYRSF